MTLPSSPLTVVCLASYFKGGDFLRQCRVRGCRVILVAREKLRDEPWPHESLDAFVTVPDDATSEVFIDTVVRLARHRRVDRVVALEEYDVLHAAMIREHLRMPGMGLSAARLFRDKLAMRVRAREAGVRVPDFVPMVHEPDIRAWLREVPPPWLIKPRFDVSAIGIRRCETPEDVWRTIELLDARPALNERASYHLVERFVAGPVYHVDALVADGEVLFAGAHRYWRPPMQVAHHGGVFVTSTLEHGSEEERELLEINRALLAALGLQRGATHAEFIRGEADGQVHFLEVAARVGGAYIAEALEAASGINLWREWANVELASPEAPYRLPDVRRDHAGVALALARQEWPDTSAFDDPEIVHRVHKRHHIGFVVRSADHARVRELLANYVARITEHHLAVLPPPERPE